LQIINNNLQSKSNQIKNEDLENGSTTTLLDDMVIFKKYTVSKGDYLEKICIKSDLDYIKNIDLIKKINDISDENSIYSDQIILLPISK
jgi:LysM repeat protein